MRKVMTGVAIVLAAASLAACEKKTETNTTINEVTLNEDVVVNDGAPVLVNDSNAMDGNIVE